MPSYFPWWTSYKLGTPSRGTQAGSWMHCWLHSSLEQQGRGRLWAHPVLNLSCGMGSSYLSGGSPNRQMTPGSGGQINLWVGAKQNGEDRWHETGVNLFSSFWFIKKQTLPLPFILKKKTLLPQHSQKPPFPSPYLGSNWPLMRTKCLADTEERKQAMDSMSQLPRVPG